MKTGKQRKLKRKPSTSENVFQFIRYFKEQNDRLVALLFNSAFSAGSPTGRVKKHKYKKLRRAGLTGKPSNTLNGEIYGSE